MRHSSLVLTRSQPCSVTVKITHVIKASLVSKVVVSMTEAVSVIKLWEYIGGLSSSNIGSRESYPMHLEHNTAFS